jgi:hypothetical protein
MSVAHAIELPSRRSHSPGSAERPGTTVRAVLLAAVAALTLALLAGAYTYLATGAGAGADDGYPDPTQQWTD